MYHTNICLTYTYQNFFKLNYAVKSTNSISLMSPLLRSYRTLGPNLTFYNHVSINTKLPPKNTNSANNKILPEAPTNCCMSGCANCVWIEYAQKLSEYFKDGGDRAIKEIEEKIDDPNMKAFLMHEFRMRQKYLADETKDKSK